MWSAVSCSIDHWRVKIKSTLKLFPYKIETAAEEAISCIREANGRLRKAEREFRKWKAAN